MGSTVKPGVPSKLRFLIGISIGIFSSFMLKFYLNDTDEELEYPFPDFNIINSNGSNSTEEFSSHVIRLADALQSSRKATLQAACRDFLNQQQCPAMGFTKFFDSRNLYSETYKFSVCRIHKCGSSSWLKAMLVMEGEFSVEDFPRLNGKMQGKSLIELGKKILRYDPHNRGLYMESKWREAYKIITVRDPFSRIVSAYNGKMVPTSPGHTPFFSEISKRICKKYKRMRYKTEDRKKRDKSASFEDFVNFLLDSYTEKDSHWQFYHESCQPCLYSYDFIMKLETLRQDIEYLKIKLRISKEHGSVLFQRKPYRSQTDLVKQTFKKIRKQKANKLYKMYEADFKMFGYEKPTWLCK